MTIQPEGLKGGFWLLLLAQFSGQLWRYLIDVHPFYRNCRTRSSTRSRRVAVRGTASGTSTRPVRHCFPLASPVERGKAAPGPGRWSGTSELVLATVRSVPSSLLKTSVSLTRGLLAHLQRRKTGAPAPLPPPPHPSPSPSPLSSAGGCCLAGRGVGRSFDTLQVAWRGAAQRTFKRA